MSNYQYEFKGECSDNEVGIYKGSDNPGKTFDEKVKNCARECTSRTKKPFKGKWAGHQTKGFIVEPSGRCFCEDGNSKTCKKVKNKYKRYDFILPYKKAFKGECSHGNELGIYKGKDNPGKSASERTKFCAKECSARTKKLFKGKWKGHKTKGFIINPSTGRCFCEDVDSNEKACKRYTKTSYIRYDFDKKVDTKLVWTNKGKGVCRDSKNKYPAWGWGGRDELKAKQRCSKDDSCTAVWKHPSNRYQFYCSKKGGVCTRKGNGGDASILRGSGKGGNNECETISRASVTGGKKIKSVKPVKEKKPNASKEAKEKAAKVKEIEKAALLKKYQKKAAKTNTKATKAAEKLLSADEIKKRIAKLYKKIANKSSISSKEKKFVINTTKKYCTYKKNYVNDMICNETENIIQFLGLNYNEEISFEVRKFIANNILSNSKKELKMIKDFEDKQKKNKEKEKKLKAERKKNEKLKLEEKKKIEKEEEEKRKKKIKELQKKKKKKEGDQFINLLIISFLIGLVFLVIIIKLMFTGNKKNESDFEDF